jgi:fatty-acyl-CoA synthase
VVNKAYSYVSGISDVPLLGHTIGGSLDRARARWSDRPALISPRHDASWSWCESAGAGRWD